MQRKLITFIAVALLAVGLAACSSSSKNSSSNTSATSGGSSSATADITIGPGLKYTVNRSVKPNAIVTVQNTDSTTHTVTSDDGKFQTDDIESGKSATFTAPSAPGQYKFHCAIHGTVMSGTLTVS